MVRCKLKCYAIEHFQQWAPLRNEDGSLIKDEKGNNKHDYQEARKIKMQIVSDGKGENEMFQAVSGGTNFELVTVNPAAYNMFKVGGEYYSDFTEPDPLI